MRALWVGVRLERRLVLDELRAVGWYVEVAPDVDFAQGVHETEGAST